MENIELSGKNIFIVSDLHMGDGGDADNFNSVKGRFLSFLDYFESLENSVLVLNGDIFEFWQSPMVDIFYNNYDLIKRLVANKAIFVAGNHDYDLISLAKLQLYKDFEMIVVKDIELKVGEKTIRVIHGNEFDPFNQPGKASFTGRITALLFAEIEENNPNSGVEGWFQKNIEPIVRGLILSISSLYKTFFANNSKLNGQLDLALEEYHKNFPNHLLVTGHIHKAGWWNEFYINCGSWLETSDASYVKIDPLRNIQLFSWPEQEEITKQVDLYGYISETAVKNLYYNG